MDPDLTYCMYVSFHVNYVLKHGFVKRKVLSIFFYEYERKDPESASTRKAVFGYAEKRLHCTESGSIGRPRNLPQSLTDIKLVSKEFGMVIMN
jgi:hypothetical protein